MTDDNERTAAENSGLRSMPVSRRTVLKISGVGAAGIVGGVAVLNRDKSATRPDSGVGPTNTTASPRSDGQSPSGESSGSDAASGETPGSGGVSGETSGSGATGSSGDGRPDPLGDVDRTNPYVYMNDQGADNLNEELALAMHASGMIDLEGFLVAYPPEHWIGQEKYERDRQSYVDHHRTVRQKAVESGFEGLPPAELGVFQRHRKPSSGRIEDTEPIGSAGTDRILRAARGASPDNPLVVAAGGDVCTLADAYLTDTSIADSVVLYWKEQPAEMTGSDLGYNFVQSGWSAYVVFNRLAVVVDTKGMPTPKITKRAVRNRVPQPLREFMLTKDHWKFGTVFSDGPKFAGDSRAILLAANPDARGSPRSLESEGLQESTRSGKRTLPSVRPASGDSHLKQVRELRNPTRQWWEPWRRL